MLALNQSSSEESQAKPNITVGQIELDNFLKSKECESALFQLESTIRKFEPSSCIYFTLIRI